MSDDGMQEINTRIWHANQCQLTLIKMQLNRPHYVTSLALVLGLCLLAVSNCSAKVDDRTLLKSLDNFGNCLSEAVYSFVNKSTCPPSSESELKTVCKQQTSAFQCIKERSRNTTALLRRGLLSYVGALQRHHRKYCTNLKGGPSQKFVAASRCLMSKKYRQYRQIEGEIAQTMFEIAKRNYTDPDVELKQICCSFHETKAKLIATIGPECSAHHVMLEELVGTLIPEELNLICEKDTCLKLEPLQFELVGNYKLPGRKTTASMTLYLVATVGQPNDLSALQ